MNQAHKAIMEKAKKEGLLPVQLAAELLVHDMVQATRAQMSRYEVGYNKMTEKQQDAVLGELQDNYKGIAEICAQVIAGAGTPTVAATLKDLTISNGTLKLIVDGTEKHFNDLIAKVQDKSDVLIVLYEREYADALDNIQSDKDQKSLPLDGEDGEKPKAKATKRKSETEKAATTAAAVVLDQAQVEKAKLFVIEHRVPTIGGIQNLLSVGFEKGKAILEELVRQFVVLPGEKENEYTMPPLENAIPVSNGDSEPLIPEVLYDRIKVFVLDGKTVSAGAIAVTFDLDDEIAEHALDLLEAEGVISGADENGKRVVNEPQA